MDKCREEFEALPLMVAILNDSFIYVDQTNEYAHQNLEDHRVTLGYVNGAWYAFQHQQAKVEELQKRVDAVIIEIENMYLSGDIGFDAVKKLEQALKGER